MNTDTAAARVIELEAELTARAKKMLLLRDILQFVTDGMEDEGDRVYFGSTNDAEQLRDISNGFDDWVWYDIMQQARGRDLYAEVRALHQRLERSLTPEDAAGLHEDLFGASWTRMAFLACVMIPGHPMYCTLQLHAASSTLARIAAKQAIDKVERSKP